VQISATHAAQVTETIGDFIAAPLIVVIIIGIIGSTPLGLYAAGQGKFSPATGL
jgi:hypothetical protein